MQFFILDLNKSNDDKFLFLRGSLPQSLAALSTTYQCRIFLILGFDKSHTTTSKVTLKNSFVKSFFIMGAERP